MTAPWPPSPREVAYFRDAAGTWFAAELTRADRWDESWLVPPHPDIADIRIAFVAAGSERPAGRPAWLAVLDASREIEAPLVVEAAMEAWARSPHFRARGPLAEEYLLAGFQALCPPHPVCDLRPNARDSLGEFLRERPAPLGALANMGRDAFNRAVRLHWDTPGAFAEAVLRERIRDDGAGNVLDLVAFMETASVALDSADVADMEFTRRALLDRLAPERFFTHARDFDAATALAREWADHYERAYRVHYRRVIEAACAVLQDIGPALAAAGELDSLNREGRAVGEGAVHRLASAVTAIRALPEVPVGGVATTGDIPLGRLPPAFSEARLAAAAVLAALEVQRRRTAATHPSLR
jgi:hypothetical protein